MKILLRHCRAFGDVVQKAFVFARAYGLGHKLMRPDFAHKLFRNQSQESSRTRQRVASSLQRDFGKRRRCEPGVQAFNLIL